jgi:putative phage-type endonuclease
MALREYPDIVQRTDEWLAVRRGIVTSSVVGRLVTPAKLAPAKNDTARNAVAAIVAERITGHTDDGAVSWDMLQGRDREPYARDAYATHHAGVREMGFMARDDWGFTIGWSPDGLVGDDGCIEIKCPRAKQHIKTIVADEVPAEHTAQIQTALLVSGRAWCDFVSFYGGMPLYRKRVLPDPEWHAAIVGAVTAFEEQAEQMAAAYRAATRGMPATEAIPDFEVVL